MQYIANENQITGWIYGPTALCVKAWNNSFSLVLLKLVLFEQFEYTRLTLAMEMTGHQASGLILEVVTDVIKTDWYLRKHFSIPLLTQQLLKKKFMVAAVYKLMISTSIFTLNELKVLSKAQKNSLRSLFSPSVVSPQHIMSNRPKFVTLTKGVKKDTSV